jgi:hypothetical protein
LYRAIAFLCDLSGSSLRSLRLKALKTLHNTPTIGETRMSPEPFLVVKPSSILTSEPYQHQQHSRDTNRAAAIKQMMLFHGHWPTICREISNDEKEP